MLFSILVAHYNNGKYLPELIQSVIKQTYDDWELIIVDDYSDESPRLNIAQYFCDKRIKYFEHLENLGVAAAFKTAIENSCGELVGLLGGDDALLPQSLEKMVNAHKEFPEASLINSDCYWCDQNLVVMGKYEFYKSLNQGEELIKNLTIGSFATFKRMAYDKTIGFDPFFRKAVDHDIYLKLDEVGDLKYVHEALYLYRSNPIGISQNENGLKAAQFSMIALGNAYHRRLGSTKFNITKQEYLRVRKKWFLRELYFVSNNRNEVLKLGKNAILELPRLLMNIAFLKYIIKALLNIK